ncbi:MAG TPA: type III secretion protein [Alphaproteobacteria bacterium]|nr:type III secretion protein [Alphaproteobacteria bacterium]
MAPVRQGILHRLAYSYLRHGQARRALALLMLAARSETVDPDLMKTLSYAFLVNGRADLALEVADRLAAEAASVPAALHLLRSRALRDLGRIEEARRSFRDYVAAAGRAEA